MLKKDEGIVIKSRRSGESSRSVTFLGKESGKIRLIAKGAFKKESPFRGILEPGTLIEAVFYHKEGRDIYFLKEVWLRYATAPGGGTLEETACVLSALELLDRVSFYHHPDTDIVYLAESYLRTLKAKDPLLLFIAFEIKLLSLLGAQPQFAFCSHCGERIVSGYFDPQSGESACESDATSMAHSIKIHEEDIAFIDAAGGSPFSTLSQMKVDDRVRKNLGLAVHWTYTYHVQGYQVPGALKLLKSK